MAHAQRLLPIEQLLSDVAGVFERYRRNGRVQTFGAAFDRSCDSGFGPCSRDSAH